MDSNAGYVVLAYAVVASVLGGYSAWLVARLRRAERSAPSRLGEAADASDAAGSAP